MTSTAAETRTVDVVDASGSRTGSAELPAELFDVTTNIPLIHQVVTAQLAAARQGTHSTKTRGEVRGGGTKPYRQKGTGRARQGSIRAPHYTGGGTVFGPTPRGYAQRTPKKMIAAALRGALSDRARDGRVRVVSELVAGETPSTKSALAALRAVTTATKLLVVLSRDEDVAWVSLRNAPAAHVLTVDQLNAYDVLCADEIVFTSSALEAFVAGGAGTAKPKAMPTLGADGGYRGDEPPAGFDIKGNQDSMKFHTPSSPWYGSTVAEVWFDSAETAEAAGFTNAQHSAAAEADGTDETAQEDGK